MPSLMVDIGANIAMIQKDLGQIQKEMGIFSRETERTFKTMGTAIKGALGAIGVGLSFMEIKNQVMQLAQAYGEQEIAETRLRAILAAHGVTNKAVTKTYAEMAASIQATTTFTDEQVLSAMKVLTVMGTAPSQIKPATDAVLMLASAFGMDLDSAAKLVGQAMEGNVERLGRIIPALKGVEKGAMSAADVFELLRGSIGDIAAREAETYIGKMKRLENQYGELKETLGSAIVPTLTIFLDSSIERVHRLLGLMGDTSLTWNKKELQLIDKEMKAIQSGAQQAADLMIEGMTVAPGEDRMSALLESRKKLLVDIGKQEKENQQILANADKDFVKVKAPAGTKGETDSEERARRKTLEALTAQYKEFYHTATQQADHYVEMQKLAGMNELNYWQETYSKKVTALDEWYDRQGEAINKYVRNEEEKQAALSKLDAEYSKQHAALNNKFDTDQVKSVEFQKKNYSSMLTWERKQAADQLVFDATMAGERRGIDAETYDLMMEYKKKFGRAAAIIDKDFIRGELILYKETFVGGWKSGLYDILQEQRAWGDVMYNTAFGLHNAMSKSFSDIFYDGVTGKLKDLEDYFSEFGKSLLRTFTDEVARKMSQQVIEIMFTASWTEYGTKALGVIDALTGMNLAGIAKDFIDLEGSWWDPGMWSQGGQIPGTAGFSGDHPGNDTIPAWVSPGEYIIPRSAVNSGTIDTLEYIRRSGRVPFASGGLVQPKSLLDDWYLTDVAQTFHTLQGYQLLLYDNLGTMYEVQMDNNAPNIASSPMAIGPNPDYQYVNWGEYADPIGTPSYLYLDAGEKAILQNLFADYVKRGGTVTPYYPSTDSGSWFEKATDWIYSNVFEPVEHAVGNAFGYIGEEILTDQFWRTVISAGGLATLGYAAGYTVPAMWGELMGAGAVGAGTGTGSAAINTAGAAVAGEKAAMLTAYGITMGTPEYAGLMSALVSASEYGGDILTKYAKNLGFKYMMGQMAGTGTWGRGGGMGGGSFNYGISGINVPDMSYLANLGGILGKEYSISARNGLDYVPYDNFPIRAHEGERVQTKEEADIFRGGISIPIIIEMDGREIGRGVARQIISGGDVTRAIDNRIKVMVN